MKWNMNSGSVATFFLPAYSRWSASAFWQMLVLFTLFFLFVLFKCHETSFLQRVALRRIALLASCTHLLFRVSKKVDKANKSQGGNQMNLVVLSGYLTQDVEIKTTQNGKAVANFQMGGFRPIWWRNNICSLCCLGWKCQKSREVSQKRVVLRSDRKNEKQVLWERRTKTILYRDSMQSYWIWSKKRVGVKPAPPNYVEIVLQIKRR